MTDKCFFIVSCARSGSTSMAQILDSASNAVCAIEPYPILNVETRLMMEGKLPNPEQVLRETVVKRVEENPSEIYGEKSVTYAPFIPLLHKLLDCKFIYLKRDGRDVVRSLMDWHEKAFGNIYREARNPGDLSPRAFKTLRSLPIHLDTSDYSRPRPKPGDPLYDAWENLTREEMCTYYWAFINELHLDQLARADADWITVDYTNPASSDIMRVVDFLNLKGIRENRVKHMLDEKINSLRDRFGEEKTYPDWVNWNGGLRRRFDKIAAKTMSRLNYYTETRTNWKPKPYGSIWEKRGGDIEWYTEMYGSRRGVHDKFIEWVKTHEPLESLADMGCGVAVGYAEAFKEKRYVGVDLSHENIKWCKENRFNPRHLYLNQDFIETPVKEKFDVVFSSGTIDNSYDMDEYLKVMVQASKRYIYLTCYRGWFPHLDQHRYMWEEGDHCFANDLSPTQARRTLEKLGCKNIVVEPIQAVEGDTAPETLITAEVPP